MSVRTETVTVTIPVTDFHGYQIRCGDRVFATRQHHAAPVLLGEGVSIKHGGWNDRSTEAGSHPVIGYPHPHTLLEVQNLPRALADVVVQTFPGAVITTPPQAVVTSVISGNHSTTASAGTATKEGERTFTTRITKTSHRRLKALCAMQGRSVESVMQEMVDEWIRQHAV